MQTLLLIDANALIHRSFHALPPFVTPNGEPTGALYGLSSILLKILKENPPDYITAAFDRPEPTFRKKEYEAYKAHRPPTPPELVSQIIKSREVFENFGIKFFEKAGFEADDIIGSLVKKFNSPTDLKITILTGDMDAVQLIKKDIIVVETPKKGVNETFIYNEEAVKKRYGLNPPQIPDYKGLVGDASDNIPGVKGIGPKTAAKLLSEFSNLENLFATIKENHPFYGKISPFKEQALFSKKLATIYCDMPIDVELNDLIFQKLDIKKITDFFEKLGFHSLIKRLALNASSPLKLEESDKKSQLSLLGN